MINIVVIFIDYYCDLILLLYYIRCFQSDKVIYFS